MTAMRFLNRDRSCLFSHAKHFIQITYLMAETKRFTDPNYQLSLGTRILSTEYALNVLKSVHHLIKMEKLDRIRDKCSFYCTCNFVFTCCESIRERKRNRMINIADRYKDHQTPFKLTSNKLMLTNKSTLR